MSPLSLMLLDTLSHKKCDSRPGQRKTQTGKEEEIEKKGERRASGQEDVLERQKCKQERTAMWSKESLIPEKTSRVILILWFSRSTLETRSRLPAARGKQRTSEPFSTLPCQSHHCLVGMSLHQVKKISTSIPPLV